MTKLNMRNRGVHKSALAFLLTIFIVSISTFAAVAATQIEQTNNDDDAFEYPLIVNPPTWRAVFTDSQVNMTMTQSMLINLTITYIDPAWGDDYTLHVLAVDPELITVDKVITAKDVAKDATSWSGTFTITAIFLGHTPIYVELRRPHVMPEHSTEKLDVIILRNIGKMDTIFQICVASFVMILYVNFGAALEMDALKRILLRPIGPTIGFIGQFIIMPVLGFLIGYFLFPDMIELRLGLFFAATTPGGGASNIFTVVLGGNLNLSITMTALSNLVAFGMMPLWIFTLGAVIFHDGNFAIPYMTIVIMSFSLVIPLCIGVALQKYAPDTAKKMSKLLKPISLVLIIFITVFAFTVNSYIFKLFTWKIIIASAALPWLGYILAWALATLLRQSSNDALTIAIETGIQNTGIAIFMLNFTLPQPQADMTSAVPVASSMMTPLPLLAIYLIRKCFCRTSIEEVEEAPCKESKEIEIESIMEKKHENKTSVG